GYRLDDALLLSPERANLKSGQTADEVLPKGGVLSVQAAPPLPQERLLVILADTEENLGNLPSIAEVRANVIDKVVSDYYNEDSYGKLSTDVDVYGWYALPSAAFVNPPNLSTAGAFALNALHANEPQVDPGQYTTLLVYSDTQWVRGFGSYGPVPIQLSDRTVSP